MSIQKLSWCFYSLQLCQEFLFRILLPLQTKRLHELETLKISDPIFHGRILNQRVFHDKRRLLTRLHFLSEEFFYAVNRVQDLK